jgi:hypothetical protein
MKHRRQPDRHSPPKPMVGPWPSSGRKEPAARSWREDPRRVAFKAPQPLMNHRGNAVYVTGPAIVKAPDNAIPALTNLARRGAMGSARHVDTWPTLIFSMFPTFQVGDVFLPGLGSSPA